MDSLRLGGGGGFGGLHICAANRVGWIGLIDEYVAVRGSEYRVLCAFESVVLSAMRRTPSWFLSRAPH